jgi:hypothetical protein
VNLSGFRGERSGTAAVSLGVLWFPSAKSSFHHCFILTYHRTTRCAIARTKQYVIVPRSSVRGFVFDPAVGRSRSRGSLGIWTETVLV